MNTHATASIAALLATLSLSLSGCGGGTEQTSSDLDAMADLLDETVEVQEAKEEADANAAARAAAEKLVAAADALEAEGLTEISHTDMQRGRKLDGGGYLSTTLRGGIAAEQKLGLATVEHAKNLFYGLEGRFPKDHDEFMAKVVEFNQIKLEPLVEPYVYEYDPESTKLMKRPSQEAIDAARAKADAALAALEG
ncbi:MAG: hypothetical protein AAF805_03935 [Planctomycetota bacterium]